MQDNYISPPHSGSNHDVVRAEISVLRVAISVVLIAILLVLAGSVTAQSVRPPGDAVNLEDSNTLGPSNALGNLSDSDIWRDFRGGDPMNIDDIIRGPIEGQMMTRSGQLWREIRENYIRKYAGWFPVGVIGILALVYLLMGPARIKSGFSGKTLPRFNLNQRVAHWFMASIFIILGLSGLIILLGRPVILPIFGPTVNSIMTSAAMQGHNLFGPLFVVALLWMFIKFIKGNFFQIVDLKWMIKLGGLIGGHVSSHQFNFGEKTWFWMVILVGIVMSATGIALEFPWLFDDLRVLQASTVLHAVGAILLISVSIGHIYIGTIGMEGSLDSMLKGEVDENWAKEHHDLWYEKVTGKSATDDSTEVTKEESGS
ncbi:MAG: formate dehydrogenase subunit gamma [Rhodobacterales bacterium]|nr:formate dehydrogenase subunit gamma [Rhodobacterales bacterium]